MISDLCLKNLNITNICIENQFIRGALYRLFRTRNRLLRQL